MNRLSSRRVDFRLTWRNRDPAIPQRVRFRPPGVSSRGQTVTRCVQVEALVGPDARMQTKYYFFGGHAAN